MLVRERGLEPLTAWAGWILSPVRLPIPPLSPFDDFGIIYSLLKMSTRIIMGALQQNQLNCAFRLDSCK